jgi:hypothetical protein
MDQRHMHSVACLGQIGDTVTVHGKGPCGVRLCLIHCSISRRIDADVRADFLEYSVNAGLLGEVQPGPTTSHNAKTRLLQTGEEFLG